MKYYVDASAARSGKGDQEHPFTTIQAAADLAVAGDEILVAPGIYREYVNPKHAGTADARITYRSTEPLGAVITGAEPVTGWKPVEGEKNVWTARVPNGIFGDYNPYTTRVSGDWFIGTIVAHTGDVYLNHKSMYEVTERSAVTDPKPSKASWDPAFSTYVWYAEQDETAEETVFYANFQGTDPNAEEVEISVRRDCFLPEQEGIGYITLSGFTVREAATQWAPPTAYQDGMIGPHWSKGWIIEDCEIYESKCSGISLGKYLQPNNDNKWLHWKYKDGTQTERDCICQASYEGWDKEHVGSHIIRHCNIHDCGQTGIVGHLGGVFSVIEDNHIHHINNKQNLAGAEIGGIKMHAAIDVIIRRNHIHNCTRGIWLDWQAQGTRVTQNLLHDNTLAIDRSKIDMQDKGAMAAIFTAMGEDLFVEVSHGPTLVDNNIMLSERAIKFASQGGAFVHNLIAGSLTCIGTGTDNGGVHKPSVRYTPYHAVHGTAVMGFMTILHGDARFYNNIFLQQPVFPLFHMLQESLQQAGPQARMWDTMNFDAGTFVYDDYPDFDTWNHQFEGYCGMGAPTEYPDRYYDHLPVWAEGNVYLGGAKPWKKEKNAFTDDEFHPEIKLVMEDGHPVLKTNLYDRIPAAAAGTITTSTLGMAFEPEEKFENPDGSPITFNRDYFDQKRTVNPIAGPFASAEEAGRPLF
ncbi:MAG: right-handed parallel beta-helix repeat-containing protein [Firmicutes bacterium]|nr:right-handed parallel beta-helix repeat-containing protein [Bacillota bacterium]